MTTQAQWNREERAGRSSAACHEDTPLYRENLAKMRHVLATQPPSSLVYAYWYGYSQGLVSKKGEM